MADVTRPLGCDTKCDLMTADGLCADCADRLRRELWELQDLYAAVDADLALGSAAGEVISGSREAPVPVRVSALSWVGPHAPRGVSDKGQDQLGALPLAAVLTEWVRLVCAEHPATPPRQTVPAMVGMLVAYLPWCIRQAWSDDYAAEVHKQCLIGRGLAGVQPDRRLLRDVPCPRTSCDALAVVRDHTTQRYECQEQRGGCGYIWTYDEWTAAVERVDRRRAG